jgi:hypothetical protein
MSIWEWVPAIKPRNSVQTVLRELIDGLKTGSIVLEKDIPLHTTQPPPAPAKERVRRFEQNKEDAAI